MPARRPSPAAALAALYGAFALAQTANAQPNVAPAAMARLSEADADGDGRVTRAEFKTARAAQFKRFDRNNDAALTMADSPPQFIAARLGLDFSEVLQVFDANKDGKVTQAEFVNGPTPAFNAADANTDGVLDAAELKAAAAARKAR